MDPADAIEYRRADTVDTELAAAKARIADLEAQIEQESDARRKQKVTIDFARNQSDKAIAEHSQRQAKRIEELEKALEPFAKEGKKFGELIASFAPVLWIDCRYKQQAEFTIGDLRRAAELLKDN